MSPWKIQTQRQVQAKTCPFVPLSQFPLAPSLLRPNNIYRPSIRSLLSIRRCFLIRRFSNLSLCAIVLALTLTGCSKSADQSATSSDPAADSSTSSSGGKLKSAMKEAAPKSIIVPAETAIPVVLDQTLSSKTATSGQPFLATVETAIEIDGRVAIPKGAHASGVVKDAKAAGRFKGGSVLALSLTSVTLEGTSYDLRASAPTFTHAGKGKRTAVAVGGGTALGAIIGGIAGGGKGAAIGAAAGAGAGAGGAAFTGKADVVLPAETALSFKLTQPLEIKRK